MKRERVRYAISLSKSLINNPDGLFFVSLYLVNIFLASMCVCVCAFIKFWCENCWYSSKFVEIRKVEEKK